MNAILASLMLLFGVGGTGAAPADGVGGTGHGAVFDGTATPNYTPIEYATW